ncbi:MAG TPA: endonuclease/exonuclease/phosphatase family protein [Anaerolineae bacterium]|nr:endonuclease/exonuclease/phosphatase family protein [Anaerolineae bacterium]
MEKGQALASELLTDDRSHGVPVVAQGEAVAGFRRSARIRILRWGGLLLIGLLLTTWVLLASRPGSHVDGCPQGCSTAASRHEGPLRVMSLNVLHGFPEFEHLPRRLDLVAAEIRRQDADIVCLQEVPWTRRLGNGAEYLAGRTGLNFLYLRANGNRGTILFEEGEAILSRYPLRAPAFVELEPRAGFFEHRMVLHATAVTPWGDVRVFATHLTAGDAAINRGQAASLEAFVAATGSGPAIVAGDLNAREDSPQIQALARGWIDTYRFANPGDAGPTCCIDDLAAESEPLEKRIDYLFLVPGLGEGPQVVSCQRVLDRAVRVADGWQWASDHVGLLAHIEARSPAPVFSLASIPGTRWNGPTACSRTTPGSTSASQIICGR